MRVIAGKARRTPLKTIEGLKTRPTTDRIKETLFNIINSDMYDAKFMDLFSGSGGIGIEALSRGAAKAYFVENASDAVNCINYNLDKTHLKDEAVVLKMDVINAIASLNSPNVGAMDFIFMDPPYNMLLEKEALKALSNTSLVDDNTVIIIESSIDTDFGYLDEMGYQLERVKNYKTNKHVFVKIK